MKQESSQVQALRKVYQASLQAKADELGPLSISELPDYLHRLAGSAGMYGYTEIADAASSLISLCETRKLQTQDSPVCSADIETARKCLIGLLRDA